MSRECPLSTLRVPPECPLSAPVQCARPSTMPPQARRKALPSGNYGGVPCLHFDLRTSERCNRPAGEGVFCNLPKHSDCWEELTEAQQTRYNVLLTNPAVAYDHALWKDMFEQYRDAKTAERQALAVAAMADLVASRAEDVAAAQKAQENSMERARQRVAGA